MAYANLIKMKYADSLYNKQTTKLSPQECFRQIASRLEDDNNGQHLVIKSDLTWSVIANNY